MISFNDLHIELTTLVNSAERSIELYSPYVIRSALLPVLRRRQGSAQVTIVTTWKIADVAFGASDPSIFQLCEDEGFALFLNQRIHLKSYIADQKRLLTGSANLTSRALGLAQNANHETLVRVEDVPSSYLMYLARIKKESTFVTSDIHEQFMKSCTGVGIIRDDGIFDRQGQFDKSLNSARSFLISALPMSSSIESLYQVWRGNLQFTDEVVAAARHDMVNYDLLQSTDLTYDQFKSMLSAEFFRHPFISELCNFIDSPKWFGAIKEWVQKNCTTVPVPSRRSLTENVQVLYQWLKILGADRFEYSRPNHSEIISPRKVTA